MNKVDFKTLEVNEIWMWEKDRQIWAVIVIKLETTGKSFR